MPNVNNLPDMASIVVREFVRAFPRFVAKARLGEVIEVRHRDGATFTFVLNSAARVQPRRAVRPLQSGRAGLRAECLARAT